MSSPNCTCRQVPCCCIAPTKPGRNPVPYASRLRDSLNITRNVMRNSAAKKVLGEDVLLELQQAMSRALERLRPEGSRIFPKNEATKENWYS